MGTDARDFSVQGRWFFRPSTFLELTASRTSRIIPDADAQEEKTTGFKVAFLGWLTPSVRAGLGFHTERISNAYGVAGRGENGFTAWLDLAWRFSGGYAYLSSKERP